MPNLDRDMASPEPTISCAECKKEIPTSEAYEPEGRDYALFFCGLECFEAWRRRASPEKARGSRS